MNHLLVIDDDIELCELLSDYLKPEGMEVTAVHDGKEGLERAVSKAGEYSLIILDVMLPHMDGFTVLQRLRAQVDTPVLMLTARDEEIDRIVGLEMGADDYLPKPFNPREVLARIRAILRRTGERSDKKSPPAAPFKIKVGDINLDTGTRMVRRDGEQIHLTSVEFTCLEILLKAAGSVVTRDELAEKALGRPLTAFDRSIDVHLSSLRKKLGHKFAGTERIKTIRNMGYIYINPAGSNEFEQSL